MTQEMDNLTQKMNEMRAEIKTYSDLEAVEQSALQEKQHLSGRKNTLQSNSTALQQLVESRRKILDVKRNAAASDASKALETQEVRITAYSIKNHGQASSDDQAPPAGGARRR